jgi:MFS family permease
VFQGLLDNRKIEKAPIIEVFKKHLKEIILSALLRVSEQAPFYIFTAFIFAYAVGTLHMSRNLILSAVLVASCVSFVTIPLSGHISDRIERRKMYLIGAATVGLFGFLYFGMVDTAIPSAVFIAIVLSLIPHDMQYGPQAALIAEAFTPRLRYSGASLGYQLASVIAGGPAPIIATALFATFQSGFAISVYIAACAVVSLWRRRSCLTSLDRTFRGSMTTDAKVQRRLLKRAWGSSRPSLFFVGHVRDGSFLTETG